jgi:hypothetical protein
MRLLRVSPWTEPKISSIVEVLQQALIRPGMHVGEVTPTAIYAFLGAYRIGIYLAMTLIARRQHEKLMEQVIHDLGLPELRSFHTILLERGQSESEVIKTMFEVEIIQTWIRFGEEFSTIV